MVGDRVGLRQGLAGRLRSRAHHALHARQSHGQSRASRLRGARRPLRRRLRNDLSRAPAVMMQLGIDGRELVEGMRTGIGRYVREVVRAGSVRGWRCTVYGDARTTLPETLPGVRLTRLAAAGTRWWDQIALPRALARDGAHVFLSPYYKGPLAAPCPVVLTIHDLYFIGYGGRRGLRDAVLTAAARLYARRARAIVSDSEHSRRAVVERLGVPPAKVATIGVAVGDE